MGAGRGGGGIPSISSPPFRILEKKYKLKK
jgi:hypothetical protein